MLAPQISLVFSVALLLLGVLQILVRRSVISVLLGLQLMYCAAIVALVSFDKILPALAGGESVSAGQGFAVLILTVVTAEAIVGLGLLVAARRNRDSDGSQHPGVQEW